MKKRRQLVQLASDAESEVLVGNEELLKMVRKMLRLIERKVEDQEMRVSVGDFIRLVELGRELAEQAPTEIQVRWIDPEESASDAE